MCTRALLVIIVLAQLLVQSINAVGQNSGSGEDDEETLQDLLDNGHSFSSALGVYIVGIGHDESFSGVIDLEFLLYRKLFQVDTKDDEDNDVQCPARLLIQQLKHKVDPWMGDSKSPFALHPYLANSVQSSLSIEQCPPGATSSLVLGEPYGFPCYKVSGKFSYRVQIKEFPFDTQVYQIILEDGSPTGKSSKLCLSSSISGLSNQVRSGSHFQYLSWDVSKSVKCYPPFVGCILGNESSCNAQNDLKDNRRVSEVKDAIDECRWSESTSSYSSKPRERLIFEISLGRSRSKALLRYFLVPIFVSLLLLATFAMHPIEHLGARFSTSSSLIISLILFHIGSNQSNSFYHSQMTRFDLGMLCVYSLLFSTLKFNLFLHVMLRDKPSSSSDNVTELEKYLRKLNLTYSLSLSLSYTAAIVLVMYYAYIIAALSILFLAPLIVTFGVHLIHRYHLPFYSATQNAWRRMSASQKAPSRITMEDEENVENIELTDINESREENPSFVSNFFGSKHLATTRRKKGYILTPNNESSPSSGS